MKKAKFANDTLYLINEVYVKEIINMYGADFSSALYAVSGDGAKVAFVTETEFASIEESAPASAKMQEVPVESAPSSAVSDEEAEPQGADPLDALLSMDNDDIVIEDE